MKTEAVFLICLFFSAIYAEEQNVDFKQLECLVCRSTVEEIEVDLSKTNPNLNIEIGNRLDAHGNIVKKSIPMVKSEIHISDIMEKICKRMDDYVRAKYKSTGELTVMKLVIDGKMNPEMSNVDIIQDSDLNKSVKHYCEQIIEDYEDQILQAFISGSSNPINEVCTKETQLCSDELPDDDDEKEEIDDYHDRSEL